MVTKVIKSDVMLYKILLQYDFMCPLLILIKLIKFLNILQGCFSSLQ